MKKILFRYSIILLLALLLTVYLYWPLYQKIPLNNYNQNINDEVKNIDLPLGEDIGEILDRVINFPADIYKLCLVNRNKFHLIHTDSKSLGEPFIFYTSDLNLHNFGKENKLGAMAIKLYDNKNFTFGELYSEVGQPRSCMNFKKNELKNYASSTIEYHYVNLNQMGKLTLKGEKDEFFLRSIASGYFIDTANSSAYITIRWWLFFLTLISIFGIIYGVWQFIVKTVFNKFQKKKNLANELI